MFGGYNHANDNQKKSRFSEPEIVEAYAKVIVNCESLTYVSFKDMRLDAAVTTTFLTAYGQSKAFAIKGNIPEIPAQL